MYIHYACNSDYACRYHTKMKTAKTTRLYIRQIDTDHEVLWPPFHQSFCRESLEWIFWLTDTEWSGTRACTEMRNIRHQTPPLTYYKNGAPPHKFFEECACRVQIGVNVKWRRKLLELQPEHLVQAHVAQILFVEQQHTLHWATCVDSTQGCKTLRKLNALTLSYNTNSMRWWVYQ